MVRGAELPKHRALAGDTALAAPILQFPTQMAGLVTLWECRPLESWKNKDLFELRPK